jgi:RNA polymerase sigma-54 factor
MALELKQNLKLTQQLVMTPQLQQAIRLLQLSRLDLVEEVNQELEVNPVLELTAPGDENEGEAKTPDEQADEAAVGREEFTEIRVEEKLRDEFDWENYLGEYSSTPSTTSMHEVPVDAPSFENFVAGKTTLTDHLTWQWRMAEATDKERTIGLQIIGNLNADGYLQSTIEELATLENVSLAEVERVLVRIQDLDPPGVAARDLAECLLIQLRNLGLGDSLAARMVQDHLPDLEKKDYPRISRVLKVPKESVFDAERVILNLEPRPGRPFSGDDPQYIQPDVYVHKVGDEYVIVLNEDGLPKLKVSQQYKDMLSGNGAGSDQAREYIHGKLRNAVWLIRSIHQRQRTIYRVTESIIRFQRDFFDRGVEYLRPLVLRDVAEDVEMHESTISRATTNKYIHTPQGLFELKFFFDSPIQRFQGEALASESVKKRIRQIVSAEDPKNPLSDQRIVEILRGANIDIARRTVAKYREMLGIAPSSRRRKHY